MHKQDLTLAVWLALRASPVSSKQVWSICTEIIQTGFGLTQYIHAAGACPLQQRYERQVHLYTQTADDKDNLWSNLPSQSTVFLQYFCNNLIVKYSLHILQLSAVE